MPYLSIIRGREDQGTPPQAMMDAMDVYVARCLEEGTVVTTGGLAPGAQGIRMRIKGNRITVTDGPFTEAREVIGGYAVISARSREEAIRATTEFLELHVEHWPGCEVECELRELVFLAP